jgi:hypothetical protein
LPTFIASCILAFDNKPRKFTIDRQRVSYAASFLTDTAAAWWNPKLVEQPEPHIRNDWLLFVATLNDLFGDPRLPQTSQRALEQLKMAEHHRVNKYMIDFALHAPYTGWNEAALYGRFRSGLAERIKDMLVNLDEPTTLEGLKTLALNCDTRHWERQSEKRVANPPAPRTTTTTTAPRAAAPRTAVPAARAPPPADRKDLTKVLNPDGTLSDAEKERRKAKGLCPYCGEKTDQHSRDCRWTGRLPTTGAGRATFVLSSDPQTASIEEVDETSDPPSGAENASATQ